MLSLAFCALLLPAASAGAGGATTGGSTAAATAPPQGPAGYVGCGLRGLWSGYVGCGLCGLYTRTLRHTCCGHKQKTSSVYKHYHEQHGEVPKDLLRRFYSEKV